MNKHTGGSEAVWTTGGLTIWGDGLIHIGHVYRQDSGLVCDDGEALANARLMAAAPKMLSVLRKVIAISAATGDDG